MTRHHATRLAGGLLAALCVTSIAARTPAHASGTTRPSVSVITRGLSAPKYLAFGPGGLYVAESGTGGPHCVRGVAGLAVTRVCAGATGSVIRIGAHRSTTRERRLASASVASTKEISGVTAVAFARRRMAVLFDDGGVGPTGASGIARPFGLAFGKLDLTARHTGGRLSVDANLAAFAATHPQSPATLGGVPGEALYDSDPHDMVAYRGGFAVADAAANDVVWVHGSGRVTVLGRLSTRRETAPAGLFGPGSPAQAIRAQAVPSSVAVGPHGALYVGLLRGLPSLPGTAEVDRIVPGRPPRPVVTGLTRVSSIAFDPRGRLDILESDAAGGGDGSHSAGALLGAHVTGRVPVTAHDLHVPGLSAPAGLAINRRGVAFITNDTSKPGHAEVIAVHGLQRSRRGE